MTDWQRRHYLAPLCDVPELDVSDNLAVLNSVEQLQLWVGDTTDLAGKSVQDLLRLQKALQDRLD